MSLNSLKPVSTPSCVSLCDKKNGRRKADLSPGAAIYAAFPEAVQPPDDRTYSAEVTVFQRNLLHHRSAQRRLRLHALDNSTISAAFCQYYFSVIFTKIYKFFRENRRICPPQTGVFLWRISTVFP